MMVSEKLIRQIVARHNLELWGVVKLDAEPTYPAFKTWIGDQKHAGMAYLERHQHCRSDPRELLLGAKSAIILGANYDLGDRYNSEKNKPRIAQYARQKDYHKVLRRRGELIWNEILAELGNLGEGHAGALPKGRVVVDSAPILERALASRTGSGFIGKNTMFIHPEKGSFYLLSEIITTAEIANEEQVAISQEGLPTLQQPRTEKGGCGSCRRCQVHCPTGALHTDYSLDANLCLSYWTIEHRGPLPEHVWPWLADYVFGCDICQLVCPYNRGSRTTPDVAPMGVPTGLASDTQSSSPGKKPMGSFAAEADLPFLARMTQEDYVRVFGGTPMTRAKRGGLMRNALVAMYVIGHTSLDAVLSEYGARIDLPEVVTQTVAQIRSKKS